VSSPSRRTFFGLASIERARVNTDARPIRAPQVQAPPPLDLAPIRTRSANCWIDEDGRDCGSCAAPLVLRGVVPPRSSEKDRPGSPATGLDGVRAAMYAPSRSRVQRFCSENQQARWTLERSFENFPPCWGNSPKPAAANFRSPRDITAAAPNVGWAWDVPARGRLCFRGRQRLASGHWPVSEWLQRICAEYQEMPGLSLSKGQMLKMWGLNAYVCDALVDALVAARVLRRTSGGACVLHGTG
jgi:hypothetical protein